MVGFGRDLILDVFEESDNMALTQIPSLLGDFSFKTEKWVSMENLFFYVYFTEIENHTI